MNALRKRRRFSTEKGANRVVAPQGLWSSAIIPVHHFFMRWPSWVRMMSWTRDVSSTLRTKGMSRRITIEAKDVVAFAANVGSWDRLKVQIQ
jgi:hypothetical protein